MGLWQRTATNIGWTALAQFFAIGIYQLVLLTLASILTPYDFGVYAACTVVNAILIQLTTLGLDYAVINSKGDWRRIVSTGAFLRIFLSLIGFGVVVLLSGVLSEVFQIDNLELPLIIVSSTVIVVSLAFPPQMELTKNLHFKKLSISKICGSATWSIMAITLALLDWSYWSLIVALVAAQIAILVSVHLLSTKRLTVDLDRETASKLVRFGGITASGLFLALLAVSVDKFVVGSVIGPDILGVYWAMFTYGTASPQLLTGIINAVMFPTYTILRDKPESLKKAYSETLRYVSEFSAPISMGLAGGSSLFVLVLLGAEWETGIVSLSLLSMSGFFTSLTSPAGNVFISTGRPDLIFRITLVFLIPMVILLVPAAYAYGIVGVSVVILGHESAKCAYVVYRAGRLIDAAPSSLIKGILPSGAAAAVAGIVVLMTGILADISALTLVIAAILGITTYLLLGQLFSKGALLDDIRNGFSAIRSR